jgi:hypothetical protein
MNYYILYAAPAATRPRLFGELCWITPSGFYFPARAGLEGLEAAEA